MLSPREKDREAVLCGSMLERSEGPEYLGATLMTESVADTKLRTRLEVPTRKLRVPHKVGVKRKGRKAIFTCCLDIHSFCSCPSTLYRC